MYHFEVFFTLLNSHKNKYKVDYLVVFGNSKHLCEPEWDNFISLKHDLDNEKQ